MFIHRLKSIYVEDNYIEVYLSSLEQIDKEMMFEMGSKFVSNDCVITFEDYKYCKPLLLSILSFILLCVLKNNLLISCINNICCILFFQTMYFT